MRIEFTPEGTDLGHIAAQLRAMNEPRVGMIFRRNLRMPLRSLQAQVRAAIASIPTHDGHSGLRMRLMRCARIFVRTTGPDTGAGIYMDTDRMPSGQYSLPLMEEGLKEWRHPVFGGSNNPGAPWVTQAPHPYFYRTVAANAGLVRGAIEKAVLEIKQILEH